MDRVPKCSTLVKQAELKTIMDRVEFNESMSVPSAAEFQRRLDAFRERVDLTSCTTRSGAPFWLREVARQSHEDLGVLALLGPTGIGIAHDDAHQKRLRARFVPDPAALALVSLAGISQRDGLAIAISCPPVARHLPLLLIGASTLAETIRRHGDVQKSDGKGILVVSSDLDIRSRYCDLLVGAQQIEEVHPGSRLRPAGDRVALTSGRDLRASPGVCFYLPRGPLPESLDYKPSLILLDLRYGRTTQARATELIAWVKRIKGNSGMIALLSVGDTDTEGQLRSARFEIFPFNHQAVQTCRDNIAHVGATPDSDRLELSIQSATSHLDRQHTVLFVENSDEIVSLFNNIGEILEQNRKIDNADLNRARWILATLNQLPIPLAWYEQTAYGAGRQTLRLLIGRIGVLSRQERLGAVLQTLRVQFEILYRYMERQNPRAVAFAQQLGRLSTDLRRSVVVIVRDRITQRAVRTWIDLEGFRDCDWGNLVDVVSCPEYAPLACERYSRALICGALPRRYRWIAGSALADDVHWLLYPAEIEIVERQLGVFYSATVLDRQARERREAMSRLLGRTPSDSLVGAESIPTLLRLRVPERKKDARKPKPTAVGSGLADLTRILAELEKQRVQTVEVAQRILDHSWRTNDGDAETAEDIETDVDVNDWEVEALKVTVRSSVHGLGHILLKQDSPIECVSPNKPSDLRTIRPAELEPADVILRLDEGGRSSLFDKIVELAENQPQLSYLARFRKEWRDALDRLARDHITETGVDYGAILRKLRENGAPIQTELTVRNWLQDYVIGPENIKSIVAVGKATGLAAVIRGAREFDGAFRRIRGLHQGIGRRLTSSIRQHFKHFAAGASAPLEDPMTLDSRLGIPLDEMLETVEFLEVLSASDGAVTVSHSRIGRFYR